MHSRLFRVALPVLLFVTEVVAQQHTSTHSQLDQYVEQVSELSSRARANVYFTNPQSIFRGVQVNFVNVGTGNLTFLRRDLVTPGRIPLVFARVYDSSGRGSVEFGPGWTLSAAETIVVSESRAWGVRAGRGITKMRGTQCAWLRRAVWHPSEPVAIYHNQLFLP